MSLIKWKTNELFPSFDSLWDYSMNRDFFSNCLQLGTTIPAANTTETDTCFQLELAIPGLKKEDFTIDLDQNVLTISSEQKEEKESKEEEKVTRREFSYSAIKRSFQLPENVNKEEISAAYVDGLLKVTLPKLETPKLESRKQIDIK